MGAMEATEEASSCEATTTTGRSYTCDTSDTSSLSTEATADATNATAPMARTSTSTCHAVPWYITPKQENMSVTLRKTDKR